MKVIAIEKYPTLLKGGSEKAYFEVLSLLKKKGHEVTLYYCLEGDLLPKLADIGIKTIRIKRSNIQKACSVRQWAELYQSYRTIDKNHDIIYLNYLHDTPLALLIKLKTGMKIICHMRVSSTLICRQLRFTGRFVDHFLVLNQRQRSVFSQHFPKNKLSVIPDGVPFDSGRSWVSRPRQGAVYVGRIAREKGLTSLLAAWKILRENYRLNIPLSITGPSDSEEEKAFRTQLASEIAKSGLQSLVSIDPYTPDPVSYLGSFEFSVFPSTCEETFGRTIVESIIAGTIVFARDIGITSEILAPESEKLIFRSEEDLSLKISRYLKGESAIDMASLYNHVRDRYNIEENIDLTEKSLLEATNG